MTKVLTTRVESTVAERLERAAQNSQMEKTAFMRKVLLQGLEQIEQETLLKQYESGQISLGKLADMLGITKWDAHALLQEKGLHLAYDEQDLKDDLRAL